MPDPTSHLSCKGPADGAIAGAARIKGDEVVMESEGGSERVRSRLKSPSLPSCTAAAEGSSVKEVVSTRVLVRSVRSDGDAAPGVRSDDDGTDDREGLANDNHAAAEAAA